MDKLGFITIQLGQTNVFLLKCNNGYLLVDTSFSSEYEKFCKELTKNNISINDIKYIFLTHNHDDHTGFAQLLRQQSGSRFIVHKNGVDTLQTGTIPFINKPLNLRVKIILGLYNKIKRRNYKVEPVKIDNNDIIIDVEEDNTILRSIGIEGKILQVKGHSDDSIIIVLDNGNIVAGDICMNFLHICGLHLRPIYLTDIKQVIKSWEKMIEERGKLVFPAHGKSFTINKLIKSYNKFK